MTRRVFFYVQHLLGIGHLKRATTLANALAAAGLEVTFASGGPAVPGIVPEGARRVQLPAASAADLGFRNLVDESGRPVDEVWKKARANALMSAWRESNADVLLIELFPFGRRQMRFELLPLLEAARAASRRPVIVSSVRDILGGGQKDPSKQDEMLANFEKYFDHVLVHSDPALIRFDRTFRHASALGDRLHYTGFISDRLAAPSRGESSAGTGEVIVSAGGGAVGMPLLRVAIQSRNLTNLMDRKWRVISGINCPEPDYQELVELASKEAGNAIAVERFRPDFPALIASCELSISQAGYNTLMDILRAGARSVVVPFAQGGEIEQSLRAQLLAERGQVEVVSERGLSPQALVAAVDRAMSRPDPVGAVVDLDGAERSATLVAAWAAR
ncbi:MAG: glycosyltransferase family protein [Betaproteobacteria bacterium]